MPRTVRLVRKPSPTQQMNKLWSFIAQTERDLAQADSSGRPILEVALRAMNEEVSRLSTEIRHWSA